MPFNKNNSYYRNANEKPPCPKCHSTANVIRCIVGWRCAYCDYKFGDKEQRGQTKLL